MMTTYFYQKIVFIESVYCWLRKLTLKMKILPLFRTPELHKICVTDIKQVLKLDSLVTKVTLNVECSIRISNSKETLPQFWPKEMLQLLFYEAKVPTSYGYVTIQKCNHTIEKTLCFKFKYTLKKMLRGFRSHRE